MRFPIVVGAAALALVTATAWPAAADSSLGPAGLTVAVDGIRRDAGNLVVTYTVANRGDENLLLSRTGITKGVRRASQISVLDPATGNVGEPLGNDQDCRCTEQPLSLEPGKATRSAIQMSDPGGATVDVLFTAFQPVLGVPVQGAPGTVSATRKLVPRTLDLLPRTHEKAARSTGSRIDLETDVLFGFDSAKLSPKAGDTLAIAAAKLKAQPQRRLAVLGHTDAKGTPAYNKTLSTQRAQAVQKALVPLLGSGWTFDVQGLGETKPVAAEKTQSGGDYPAGRALNRRVELSVS